MKKFSLNAQARTILGHKSKQLRRQGKIPANIFGKHISSLSIEVVSDEFKTVYSQAKETGLVELSVDKKIRPVLVKLVQVHPVTGAFIHVDFYQVDLTKKVSAHVPLQIIHTAAAVSGKLGVLLTLIDDINVSALPADLPEKIEVSVANLAQVGDAIKVKDLKLPKGVEVSLDSETELVKIGALITKEAQAQAAADEAAAAATASVVAENAAPADAAASAATASKSEENKKTG